MTTSERWRLITALFHAALDRDPLTRSTFLARECGDDLLLRRDVEAMLAGHEQADGVDAINTTAAGPAEIARLAAGSQLGPYEIRGFLGAGGMGHVYRAFDPRLHREVAIKLSRERFTERFEREVRVIATLNHPNICTVYDVGPTYLVTELVEGKTLRDWLRQELPVERILGIIRQVLEALRAAHRASIVHRDLKPENVMVRFDGYVKVLDFGLATTLSGSSVAQPDGLTVETQAVGGRPHERISRPGQLLGTVAYMSPEQIRGGELDHRSDLFAVGIMFYEMLTRKHPWTRPSAGDILQAILNDDPSAIPVGSLMEAELAAIVRKLLRKDPARRYASAEAVLEALGGAAPVQGTPDQPARATGLTSIAVLPFQFLNDIESRDTWSLGFADALITVLGRVDDLTVLPTAAILKHAGADDLGRTARDLGVRHVLQGTVQKFGAQWRVSIQLFDGMTERITFSEQYDFRAQNAFEVQDDIGREVIAALRRRFPRTAPRARDRYSSDPLAFNEFMAGLRDSYSDRRETLEQAVQHLTAALESDPEFPLAHAWLSYVSMNLYFSFDSRPSRLEQAEHHCSRALALDPALPEGHLARASILWSPGKGFQHADALEALGKVVAVQPGFEQAHNRIASICLHIGRFEEARQAHANARRSNPKTRTGNLEFIHLYSGDLERAEKAAEAWVQERPGATYALFFYPQPPLLSGNLDLAEQRLALAQQQLGDDPLIITLNGMLRARQGQAGPALDCVRVALSTPRSFGHTHHTYYQVACIYAVLGDTANAMAWLERSVDTGFPCWPFFKVDPHLQRLRDLSEFNQLVGDLERKYKALTVPAMAGRAIEKGSSA